MFGNVIKYCRVFDILLLSVEVEFVIPANKVYAQHADVRHVIVLFSVGFGRSLLMLFMCCILKLIRWNINQSP